MDRLVALLRLLSVVLVLAVAGACSSENCEPNPEEGEYCESLPTAL